MDDEDHRNRKLALRILFVLLLLGACVAVVYALFGA